MDEFLPELIEDNKRLKSLIDEKFSKMKLSLESSFNDFRNAVNSQNSELFISSLVNINSVYGMRLRYLSFNEFDSAMIDDKPILN